MPPFELPLFAYPLLLLTCGVFFRVSVPWGFAITVVITWVSFRVLFFMPILGLFFGFFPLACLVVLVCGVRWVLNGQFSPWVLGPSLITVIVGGSYVLQGEPWCTYRWWC